MSDNMSQFILPLAVIGIASVAIISISKPLGVAADTGKKAYEDTKDAFEKLDCLLRVDGRNCTPYPARGGETFFEHDDDPSYFPGPKALGSVCNRNSDCSATEVYGGGPARGKNVECRNNICSRVNLLDDPTHPDLSNQTSGRTAPLGGSCNMNSDCSSIEIGGGPPAKGEHVECRNKICNRVRLV